MSACKDMNYCRESEAVCRHNTKKRVKKSFKLFLQMAAKSKPGSIHIDPGSFLIGICI